MDELVDSTPIRTDRGALRERLAADGYLFFRALVDPGRVREVRLAILNELARRGWLADGSDPAEARPGPVIRSEVIRTAEARDAAMRPDGWFGGYRAIQSLELFHQFAFDARLLAMLRTVVADDAVPHPRKIARVVYPGDPTLTTAPHQDYTHIQGTSDFVTCWLPLGDYPRGAGGLRILRASGVRGIRPTHRADGAGGIGSELGADETDWLSTSFAIGDVLLFHCLTVHAGTPNESESLRLSVDFRYQSAAEPIAEPSLLPHMSPAVPDWPELTAGWSSTEWVVPPTATPTVPFLFPSPETIETWHERIPLPPPRLVPLAAAAP